ncbi:MAG TPA: hypothetical protein VFX37_10465 [Pseudolabrys sp.]|nr:hypothetical protein [Pseudolabrys sp.]
MAEVDTSIYKNAAGAAPMNPLQVLQLLTLANENKLFQQTYGARQGIADAYRNNVDPEGNLDTRGLQRDVATKGGFLAPEAVGQGVANSTAQFNQQVLQLNHLRSTVSSLASLPSPTMRDVNNWAVTAARNTNAPAEMIQGIVDGAAQFRDDPKALKAYIAKQGILASGTGALSGQAGPPTAAGTPTQISTGEAILRRAGVGPGQRSGSSGGMPPTGMATGVAPGFGEAAGASGAQMANERAKAATFGSDMFAMNQLKENLEKLGKTGTGPGTQDINNLKSFVQTNLGWVPGAKTVIGDPSKISNYDEAVKYATQLAANRASMFGHGTDQALATSLIGSPNTHISNLGGVDLTKAIIGLRRMEQAQILEADRQEIQPGQYSKFAARFATSVDPRGFMFDQYDKKQLQNIAKTLKTPAQRQRFNATVKLAIDNGLIDNPSAPTNAGQ